jgi:type I restriction enzyme M protein
VSERAAQTRVPSDEDASTDEEHHAQDRPCRQAGCGRRLRDKLWAAADVLRNNMDPAEYKHVVLGLIFLKYISDAFEERQEQIIRRCPPTPTVHRRPRSERTDRDEYTAENVFWVPQPGALVALPPGQAKQPTIGKALDDAMDAIERRTPSLKGALPKVYALPERSTSTASAS